MKALATCCVFVYRMLHKACAHKTPINRATMKVAHWPQQCLLRSEQLLYGNGEVVAGRWSQCILTQCHRNSAIYHIKQCCISRNFPNQGSSHLYKISKHKISEICWHFLAFYFSKCNQRGMISVSLLHPSIQNTHLYREVDCKFYKYDISLVFIGY